MRIACPFSSGNWLTSAMTAPPLLRIGSISIGFEESNTSQTASARRNNAAGVAVAKENFRRRPSPSRVATTEAAPSPAFVSGAGSDAATAVFGDGSITTVFGGSSVAAAIVSCIDGSVVDDSCVDGGGTGASEADDMFGAVSGLISILACSAMVSDVGGAIPPDFHNGAASAASFSGAVGAAAAGTGAARAGAAGVAAAGAADTGAREASAAGDGSANGFFRLLESHVDNVVFLLAEGVHIDLADQRDFHRGGFAVDLLIDRCDIRWRRQLGVGQIEGQRGVETAA